MNPNFSPSASVSSPTEAGPNARETLPAQSLKLVVLTRDNVPSFKNSKRSILDRNTGKQRTLTPGKMKKRMDHLEQSIVSALLSLSRTGEGETALACRRRLLTVSLELCDDSLKVVPEFSFGVRYVEPGQEGVEIEITKLLL